MTSVQQTLQKYYASIIHDSNAFESIDGKPLPTCVWTNSLKIEPKTLQSILQGLGIAVEPLSWTDQGFRCQSTESLGKTWPYFAGLLQIQEEVSMLPVQLLDPQPGEKILDLCAAPGNKTAQISVAMKNTGTVVANDRNYGRMRALGQIMKRLSLVNISSTIYDAVGFPGVNNYFDKVLADVPCSCEGTYRKSEKKVVTPNRERSLRMANVQKAILRKAIALCKPGGRIVYSTCTFAPEENERVISETLNELGETVKLKPIAVPGFEFSPGVTQWQGENFHSDVTMTMRVWPHQNNTGGFYVAVLEKLPANVSDIADPKRFRPLDQNIQDYLDIVQQRYSFNDDQLAQFRYLFDSQRGIYLTNQDNQPPKGLKYDAIGLFAIKTKTRFPKLTTSPAMLLGQFAQQNRIALTPDQLDGYYAIQDVELSDEQIQNCTDQGFVIVEHADQCIGTGIYLPPHYDAPPRLRSLFPKYLA